MGNGQSEFLDTEYFYRDDGTIEAEWTVLDGVRHGYMRVYYKSGNLRERIQYVRGIQHGVVTGYFDGVIHRIQSKCTYVNGRKHGVESIYDLQGNMIEYQFYDRGNMRRLDSIWNGHPNWTLSDKLDIWWHEVKCRII